MTLTIQIENKEDYVFIKQLLERLKGVKVVPDTIAESYEDGTPKWFVEKLSEYADHLNKEELVSEEQFSNFVKEERCRFNSQKGQ